MCHGLESIATAVEPVATKTVNSVVGAATELVKGPETKLESGYGQGPVPGSDQVRVLEL